MGDIFLGFTTFLTLVNLVADWGNFADYTLRTKRLIIENNNSDTADVVLVTLAVLCGVSSALGLLEMKAFVQQFKDTRNHLQPMTRSERYEEVISYLLLLVENTGIPLLFLSTYFVGSCTVAAHVRSLYARLAFFAAGVCVLWRAIQSFAYCCNCRKSAPTLMWCSWARYLRVLLLAASLAIIALLLSISLSLDVAMKIDERTGHIERRTQYRDTVDAVYLYQRFQAPYTVHANNETLRDCSFFETRIRYAAPVDIEKIHKRRRLVKMPCADVSQFYELLLPSKHRSLATTYDCDVIVGLHDSDLRSARLINVGYELRDPDSSQCVSGHIDLEFDKTYDDVADEGYQLDLEILFTQQTQRELMLSVCDQSCINSTTLEEPVNSINIDCSGGSGGADDDDTSCMNYVNETSYADVIGYMSTLLVPERELMSLYPCMPSIALDTSLELHLCNDDTSKRHMNGTVTQYTTCRDPFIINT